MNETLLKLVTEMNWRQITYCLNTKKIQLTYNRIISIQLSYIVYTKRLGLEISAFKNYLNLALSSFALSRDMPNL